MAAGPVEWKEDAGGSARSRSLQLPLTPRRKIALGLYIAAIVLNIAVQNYWLGVPVFLGALWFVLRDETPALRRRLGVLLACVAILTITDINTSLTTANFLQLGIPFALVVFFPGVVLARTDPGVIRYRLWPRRFRRLDLFYVIISIPLSWALLKFYWWMNPFMPTHWILPAAFDRLQVTRLIVGINSVGIWDELFFVNVSFAVLRSLFRFRTANAVQAVLYTSVLYDMAFTGIGPFIVGLFAWTQAAMFEESENLLYVLVVHLIVDAFLVMAILSYHYPGH